MPDADDGLALGSGDFTVAMWVKFTMEPQDGGIHVLLEKYAGTHFDGSNGWVFYAVGHPENTPPDRHLELYSNEGGWNFQGFYDFTVDQWYHIAATWDGKTIKVYLDGDLDKSSSTGAAFNRTGPHPLYIGLAPVYKEPFDGLIDEVAIYDRPLTAKELQQDMKGVVASVFPSGKLATAWGHLKSQ